MLRWQVEAAVAAPGHSYRLVFVTRLNARMGFTKNPHQNPVRRGDDCTHSSLLALINEHQQTGVPCHQTNRIKTMQVWPLRAGCAMLLNDRLGHIVSGSSGLQHSLKWLPVLLQRGENNRGFLPVGTSFHLFICPFTVEHIHLAVSDISDHHTSLQWHMYLLEARRWYFFEISHHNSSLTMTLMAKDITFVNTLRCSSRFSAVLFSLMSRAPATKSPFKTRSQLVLFSRRSTPHVAREQEGRRVSALFTVVHYLARAQSRAVYRNAAFALLI